MTDAPPLAPPIDVAVVDPAPTAPRRSDALAVFLVAFALLAAFAGVRELWDADEGRYASVALDMARSGDYVTPRENGLRFVDKPPLVYWMANGAYAVLGATPFAARLPCIVSGAGLSLAAFLLAAAWSGRRRVAWCAALVLATSVGGMGFSRTVTMDMPLAAAAAFAIYAGWRALESDEARWRVMLGLFVGLGLLAKGPLGAVLPALVALSWGVVGAPWRRIFAVLFSPLAWIVALALAAPWYALMERANPGYLQHFLVYEHFGRFAEKGNREFAPFWLYVPTLAAFLLPWLPLLPGRGPRLGPATFPAPGGVTTEGPAPAAPRRSNDRFAWAWVVVLLVFYSAGKNRLFTYCLPAFLPLALMTGARLSSLLGAERTGDGARVRFVGFSVAFLGLLALGCAIVLMTGVPFTEGWKGFKDDRHVLIGLPAAIGSVPLVLMPLWLALVRAPRLRAGALFLAAAAFFWGVDLGCARANAVRSPTELAKTLVAVAGRGDAIVCLDLFPQGLRFTTDVYVRIAGKQGEIVEPWASKDGEGVLMSKDALDLLWNSSTRVVLVVREDKAKPYVERGGRVLASRLSGAQRSDLMVVENHPRGR